MRSKQWDFLTLLEKYIGWVLACVSGAIVAVTCVAVFRDPQMPADPPFATIRFQHGNYTDIGRIEDREHGVVCYVQAQGYKSGGGISCVRVTPSPGQG